MITTINNQRTSINEYKKSQVNYRQLDIKKKENKINMNIPTNNTTNIPKINIYMTCNTYLSRLHSMFQHQQH